MFIKLLRYIFIVDNLSKIQNYSSNCEGIFLLLTIWAKFKITRQIAKVYFCCWQFEQNSKLLVKSNRDKNFDQKITMSKQENYVQPKIVVQAAEIAPKLGPNPQTMICPHCRTNITTRIETNPSTMTWAICAGLCLLG